MAAEFDPEDPIRELGSEGEDVGGTFARALGNIQRRAEDEGGEIIGVVVIGLLSVRADGHHAEGLVTEFTPGLGPSRRMGMLLWALDLERE